MMKKRTVSGMLLTLLLVSMLMLIFNIQPVKSEPGEIYVPSDYKKIQWAVGNASAGDTILVAAGTYYEHVTVDKSLTLVGDNPDTTIIDGNGTGTVVNIRANNINISGFTIQKSGPDYLDRGIWVCSSGNDISHTIIINNGVGIWLEGSGNNTLTGNIVSSNSYVGIELHNSSNNIFVGNNASNNKFNFRVWRARYFNYIDTSNRVDGKPIYYLEDVSDTVYDARTNAGTIYLINCNNITIRDLTLKVDLFSR